MKFCLINSLNNNFVLIKLFEKQLEKQTTYDQIIKEYCFPTNKIKQYNFSKNRKSMHK